MAPETGEKRRDFWSMAQQEAWWFVLKVVGLSAFCAGAILGVLGMALMKGC